MTSPTRRPKRKERGALMVALMAGIAIMAILTAVAAQNWSDVVRRDNEAEMIFRAEDIVRALKRFQKDKGKLPNDLKELLEPGQKGQYFIRQLWKDPLVKGGKWQLLYAAPGGGLFDPTVTDKGNGLQPPGQVGAIGEATPDPNGAAPPSGIEPIIKHDDGSPDVSGMPIAGVKTKCTDRPFRLYRDKTEYSQWAFSVFDAPPQAVGTPGQANQNQPGLGQPKLPDAAGGGGGATFPPKR